MSTILFLGLLIFSSLSAVIPEARASSIATGVQLIQVVSTNTGTGKISHGQLATRLAVSSGDFLVVLVGINQVLHPVASVADSAGNTFTDIAVAAYPTVAPDAWVAVWVASVTSAVQSDTITVAMTSNKDNLIVLEYSGVSGVGNVAANGGKSSTASVSINLQSPTNTVVAGVSTFTGKATTCGFQAPFVGGVDEECIGTTSNKNNVGTLAIDKLDVGSSSLGLSAALPKAHAWAFVAVELLSW